MIYDHLFVSTLGKNTNDGYPNQPYSGQRAALLATSSVIYHEAKLVLYEQDLPTCKINIEEEKEHRTDELKYHRTFRVVVERVLPSDLCGMPRAFPTSPNLLKHVKHLEIVYTCFEPVSPLPTRYSSRASHTRLPVPGSDSTTSSKMGQLDFTSSIELDHAVLDRRLRHIILNATCLESARIGKTIGIASIHLDSVIGFLEGALALILQNTSLRRLQLVTQLGEFTESVNARSQAIIGSLAGCSKRLLKEHGIAFDLCEDDVDAASSSLLSYARRRNAHKTFNLLRPSARDRQKVLGNVADVDDSDAAV